MLTTPFDIVKVRLHRWFHDYSHRAQDREKQIKRWRKFKMRLAEELAKREIVEMRGWWYFPTTKSIEHNDTAKEICWQVAYFEEQYQVAVYLRPVRALFSHIVDMRISGPGESVVFGRKTNWGKGKK